MMQPATKVSKHHIKVTQTAKKQYNNKIVKPCALMVLLG